MRIEGERVEGCAQELEDEYRKEYERKGMSAAGTGKYQ
jgi:hypothetical protein